MKIDYYTPFISGPFFQVHIFEEGVGRICPNSLRMRFVFEEKYSDDTTEFSVEVVNNLDKGNGTEALRDRYWIDVNDGFKDTEEYSIVLLAKKAGRFDSLFEELDKEILRKNIYSSIDISNPTKIKNRRM